MRSISRALVIVVAIFAASWAAAAAADPAGRAGGEDPAPGGGVEVPLEHLVIAPSPDEPGSYQILDVFRLRRAGNRPQTGPVRFAVPLPPGYRDVRVMGGLAEGNWTLLEDRLEGIVEWTEPDGSATVAVAYRLPDRALPHPWALVRPFPVGALLVMVHPRMEAAAAGAEQAGSVDLGGTAYLGFVREDLPAGEPVLLAARLRGSEAGRGLPWPAQAALAVGVLAAAGVVAAAARRGRDPRARRRRLVDAVLALEGEYAAGYLEPERYRRLRERLMRQLAGELAGGRAIGEGSGQATGGGGVP